MDVQEAEITTNLNIVIPNEDVGTGPVVGSSKLGFKFGGKPTEVSKLNRANRNSCKGYKCGKTSTKAHNVGKDISPSKGKSKQGSWKRKEGRPVEEAVSCCMDIDVGQKRKKIVESTNDPEPSTKRGKTIAMFEPSLSAEVARQPRRAQ